MRAHCPSHGAPRKPVRKSTNIDRSRIQTNLVSTYSIGQGRAAEPYAIKSHDVGRHEHVDVEARVFEADGNIGRLDNQPIALLRTAAKIELDHNTASRNFV